ncbi:hypothetical protein C0581_03350 [Candidatus Parcubacteria bacterium]|nr:MAG: hypothetical protein C0581_03350 [Candidatus Parcubacteria bacterium]
MQKKLHFPTVLLAGNELSKLDNKKRHTIVFSEWIDDDFHSVYLKANILLWLESMGFISIKSVFLNTEGYYDDMFLSRLSELVKKKKEGDAIKLSKIMDAEYLYHLMVGKSKIDLKTLIYSDDSAFQKFGDKIYVNDISDNLCVVVKTSDILKKYYDEKIEEKFINDIREEQPGMPGFVVDQIRFKKQKQIFVEGLKKILEINHPTDLTITKNSLGFPKHRIPFLKDNDSSKRTDYNFVETALALERQGLIEINKFYSEGDLVSRDGFSDPEEDIILYINVNENILFSEDSQKESPKSKLSFNNVTSVLTINNKEVLISKTKNSQPHYLLSIISKDWEKDWNADQIADGLGDNEINGEKYYQAGIRINHSIASETGIKKFLIVSRKKIQLNPQNYNLL